jgi:hypothetical protein
MTKVVERSLTFGTDRRLIWFSVSLPERAAPNLALGARLTWESSTAGTALADARAEGLLAGGPAAVTIAERLNRRIDVDFRDEPLSAAIEFIGAETDVRIRLDGPSMKLGGVTQNEKQRFTLSGALATAVLGRILNPRGLVLIIDEQNETATITSAKAAEAARLTPFPLEAPP